MDAFFVEPNAFICLALDIMARRPGRTNGSMIGKLRRFRSFFGVSPEICSRLWGMLDPCATMENGAVPEHLLWALMFMKIYATNSVLCALVGGVDEKTYRKWTWIFVNAISYLEGSVILWRNRLKSDIGKTCLVTIDGTDFRIQNVKPFWRGWYSHKFHGPGIRYEVAICIQTGDIVWINGPFACGVFPDITIFRSGLIHELRRGEKVEADDGYRGEGDFISTPDDYENEEQHHEKDLARARHETGNGRFAVWNCLKYVFRHDVRKHSEIFRAVATITQLSIENGEPLFPVDYIYNN